ncbi:hypothetical protein DBV15_00011, partial [Temnothorax longispinosus]
MARIERKTDGRIERRTRKTKKQPAKVSSRQTQRGTSGCTVSQVVLLPLGRPRLIPIDGSGATPSSAKWNFVKTKSYTLMIQNNGPRCVSVTAIEIRGAYMGGANRIRRASRRRHRPKKFVGVQHEDSEVLSNFKNLSQTILAEVTELALGRVEWKTAALYPKAGGKGCGRPERWEEARMTGSIRLRRDDDRNVDDDDDDDDDDSFGNICGSTFFYDSSNKRTKKAEERTSRLDMPLENLTRNFLRKKSPVPENPLTTAHSASRTKASHLKTLKHSPWVATKSSVVQSVEAIVVGEGDVCGVVQQQSQHVIPFLRDRVVK